jgi:class 3 adenylate cyclase
MHNDMVRRAIESYKGAEVNQIGCGIGASFYAAARAVGCALQIQKIITKRNAVNSEDTVKVRVGLSAGRPDVQGSDRNGILAELARQICEMAKPGQVLVSNEVRQLVAGKGFGFSPGGVKSFKGSKGPVPLYKLDVG